jgi:hypothetical protein
MSLVRVFAMLAALVLAGPLPWVDAAAAQAAATPESLAAARELVAIVSKDTMRQVVTQVANQVWPPVERALRTKYPDISPTQVAELRGEFERIQLEYLSTVMDDAPVIYARHFSADELRELLAFYRSPIGAKALRVLPQITAESMALIMPRIQQVQVQTMEAFTKVLRLRGFSS